MTEETAKPAAARFTYIGRRKIAAGKIVHAFYKEDERDSFTFWKAKPSTFTGCRIGVTYLIGESFPTIWSSAIVGEATPDEAATWEGRDRATFLESQDRKQAAAPQTEAALEVLRKARGGVPFAQRVAFDTWILNSIR